MDSSHTPKSSSYGITSCGTGIAAIKQTKYGPTSPTVTWSLPNLSTHLYDGNLYYIYGGYESDYYSNGYFTITSPPTSSGVFQNQGSGITNQSMCLGGGSIMSKKRLMTIIVCSVLVLVAAPVTASYYSSVSEKDKKIIENTFDTFSIEISKQSVSKEEVEAVIEYQRDLLYNPDYVGDNKD